MNNINIANNLIPEYNTLCSLDAAKKSDIHCVILAYSVDDVFKASSCGYSSDEVFYFSKCVCELENILGKCRMVATDFTPLQQIDTYLQNSDLSDKIVTVGLSVIPNNYSVGSIHSFTMSELSNIVCDLRKHRMTARLKCSAKLNNANKSATVLSIHGGFSVTSFDGYKNEPSFFI